MRAVQPNAFRFNNVDCYALIGDSIATGGVAPEPVDWPDEYKETNTKSKILFKEDRTVAVNSSILTYDTQTLVNRFPGYGVPYAPSGDNTVGIDNTLMYYLGANTKKSAICLLKWALGGTRLLTDWAATGSMYLSLRNFYQPKIGLTIDEGLMNPTCKAVVICLGTNDCISGNWDTTNFTNAIPVFIGLLREFLGASVPIYWNQVRSDLYLSGLASYPQANVNACRLALSNCAAGGATPISGFNLLDFESQTSTYDSVHPDADAGELMGLSVGATLNAL